MQLVYSDASDNDRDKTEGTLDKEWASLVAQMVKNLPAMQETWV